MSRNREVADLLYKIAKILEIQKVQFKPRAYQRAAVNVESLAEDIETLVASDRLREIPGVGEAIAEKIREYVTSGKLRYLEELQKQVPDSLLALMNLSGVGPKTAQRLHDEFQIRNLDDLRKALDEHRLLGHKGIGEKTEEELRKALGTAGEQKRVSISKAHRVAEEMRAHLTHAGLRGRMEFAGSFRRGRDTVGDLDLLVEASEKEAGAVIDAFTDFGRVRDVVEKGGTRSRVVLSDGLHVDLRVVAPTSFGAALVYFTGSKEHNIALRSLALRQGFTLNEYALSRKKDGKPLPSVTEEAVYQRLGLQWVPPELRENRGEIDLAAEGTLPTLIGEADLRGDLHTHTRESDGDASAETMLRAAAKKGYEYFGVSDHSQTLRITNGLDPKRLSAQRRELERLQEEFPTMTILQGCEVDILKDGSLDLTSKARSALDYVIGSVHGSFKLPREEQTRRVLAAMDAGIDILGHPTARKILERPSIELDMERVAEKAAERGVLLEIDATPDRIDLWGELVKLGRDRDALFVIDSDAHSVSELEHMPFGVTQARRGWLERRHVLNAQPLAQLRKHLGHAKRS